MSCEGDLALNVPVNLLALHRLVVKQREALAVARQTLDVIANPHIHGCKFSDVHVRAGECLEKMEKILTTVPGSAPGRSDRG